MDTITQTMFNQAVGQHTSWMLNKHTGKRWDMAVGSRIIAVVGKNVCLDNWYGCRASFEGCRFPNGSFNQAWLPELVAQNTWFDGADMYRLSAAHALFTRCIFTGASLNSAMLKGAVFLECDLRNCSLTGADLDSAAFINCNLRRADFMDAKLTMTRFNQSTLVDACFQNAVGVDLDQPGVVIPYAKTPEGTVIGYVACKGRRIAVVEVKPEYRRKTGTTTNIFAETVTVRNIISPTDQPYVVYEEARTLRGETLQIGATVSVEGYDPEPFNTLGPKFILFENFNDCQHYLDYINSVEEQ